MISKYIVHHLGEGCTPILMPWWQSPLLDRDIRRAHISLVRYTILLSVLIGTVVGSPLVAQDDLQLSSLLIPKELQKGASVVVRYDDTEVRLKGRDEYEVAYSYAMTVMNSAGLQALEFVAPYKDGSEKLSHIELSYHDLMGQVLKEVKTKELEDQAASSASELIGDGRIKKYTYIPLDYPVTVKVSYKRSSRNTMFLPSWIPIRNFRTSIQSSTYTLINQSQIPLRWSLRNLDQYSSIQASPNLFVLKDQVAITPEPYSKSMMEMLPLVFVIPEHYSYEGKEGYHTNWQEFGANMYQQFLTGKSDLDHNKVKKDLAQYIDPQGGKRDIVKALYDYVQEHTRYIFISLGDGGFAPLTAQKVHDVKYGDCKALSFYMKSLLEVYDIPANYVQVHADVDIPLDVFSDFAYTSPSNHVIINVPLEQDTIWLDCTSQLNPFNYLGSFTDDRLAFEIHPDGGHLVRTPRYDLEDNVHIQSGSISLSDDGHMTATIDQESRGLFYEDGLRFTLLSAPDLDEYLKTDLFDDLNRLVINAQSFQLDEEAVICSEHYELEASGYSERAGDYLLVNYSFIKLPVPRLPSDKHRKNEVYFPRDVRYVRALIYDLPTGYRMKLPEDKIIEDDYGSYKRRVEEVQPGKYKITRTFDQFKGLYPASDYNNIKRFFDLIIKAEREKFSISKKT